MRMIIGLALVATLFLGVPAFADTFTTGDILTLTGFDNANSTNKFWAGSFTLGTAAGPSLWNVSAFAVDPLSCATCTPSSPPWTLGSLEFDSATGDLSGKASANFSGLKVSVHLLTLTFVDGNNTSDAWSDVSKFGTKIGTFSYCTGVNCTNPNATPEPSTCLLLATGLMSLVGRRLSKHPNR